MIMETTLNKTLSTEIWQNIGAIADNEALMERLARYTRRLVKEKESDPTLMTKEEFFSMIDQRMESYEEGNHVTMKPEESLDQFLDRVEL